VETLSLEDYITLLERCLRVLPPEIVVHRLTGDGDKKTLLAPLWSADKKRVLNEIRRRFDEDSLVQGSEA
jgi:radical SAM superfamily enzyme